MDHSIAPVSGVAPEQETSAPKRIKEHVHVPPARSFARSGGGRSLMDDHDVRKRRIEQGVIPAHECLQRRGERAQLAGVALDQARAVRAQDHVRFIRPARRVGDIRGELLGLIHEPPAVPQLALQQGAQRATPQARVRAKLELRQRRKERVGVHLPVRVMQGDAR